MLPVIHLFGINIYPYGMMIALGIICAVTIFMKRCDRSGYDEDSAFNMAVICCICGILGAKVLYIIIEFPNLMKNPIDIIKDFGNGFVIYGGVIGGILAGFICTRRKKWPFFSIFDIALPLIALAQGFGRLGCLFAGCCYGRETRAFYGITFHNSPYAPNNVRLIPTQIFSSIGDFIIFGLLILFDRKIKKADGQTGAMYLILYSIGRFIIEFFRDDPRGTVFNVLSTSQFICIFTLAAGIILFMISSKRIKSVENIDQSNPS